ncbi:DNA polymerase III subunit alpha [Marinigracilibium pacificum]|uniref:DNA-directed DNA polymerase n=1 Tax=Marinigracilibium pacificum TaxID=2729599 RepID=A0A848J8A3_9BACT|nr:DNA polymerase III subunit alpha [Marinigracilibium pacificum]NMM50654.1 DNA polymerase III subunit alpha [Marinigracilibium pacificum]
MYLNCHTWFSLKYGTLSPQQLIDEALKNGIHKLVLTDIHNTSAYIELIRLIKEQSAPLEIITGIEFRNNNKLAYILIARSNKGFELINRYLSGLNTQKVSPESRAPQLEDTYIIYPWANNTPVNLKANEYIGIRPEQTHHLYRLTNSQLIDKGVILQPVTFNSKTGYNTHRLLRAIHHNTLLSKLDPGLQASQNEFMVPESKLLEYYWQYPKIIANTEQILENCNINFELGTNKNKKQLTDKASDHHQLKTKALEGFRRRYEHYNSYAMERLLKELDVIEKHGFESYFLITLDIIEYAKHKNYAHVGRGSGANSMVAYCLGITEVDPIELDLYFERFLNPYRSSPPDFDIDFSWQDRDDVTRYIFERHGTEHTALLATYVTFQGRSIIRELGKVFGLPKEEIDKIVREPARYANSDEISGLIFRYGKRLQDMPRNLSIHAGGVLITEKPIYSFTATDLPPKGFPITHFDMFSAEDMGIHKYDILSQRGLGHIKDSVALVGRNKKINIDITRTEKFKKDDKIKQLLRSGRTMGAFYVESPAMRMLLGKLKCEDYITLVAASSIIRPGVARSGMMREYIQRHHNPDNFEYLHPKMKELMKETYGVMVYQEDVIKVAHHFAGLDLAEADILRRGMSGKYRSRKEFQRVEEKFFTNCKEKGYPEAIYKEVWRQIESFSGYSFSKAHSASYAVESYQSLYLKAHFPIEFMVGVINNFGGFYKTEFYFHEAKRSGAIIQAPCVNNSEYLTSINGKEIFVGFIHLKSLETKVAQRIVSERKNNGPFTGLQNFIERVMPGPEQIYILIRIGAFRFTGEEKRALLWQSKLYYGNKEKSKAKLPGGDMFNSRVKNYSLPKLDKIPFEDAFDELELLGFPLCDPFNLLPEQSVLPQSGKDMSKHLKKRFFITGYLVTIKHTHTKDKKTMFFGTFIDKNGDFFDTTHFPNTAKQYPFRGAGFYNIEGIVVEDFGYPMIEVSKMEKMPMIDREKLREKELRIAN